MDAAQLRQMQAPIKERYKTDPKTALITLKAKGSTDSEGIACKVETGRAIAMARPVSILQAMPSLSVEPLAFSVISAALGSVL